MEMYKWDPWWENDWPVSTPPKALTSKRSESAVAVEETEGGYRIRTNVAEFRKEDIDVTVDQGRLEIVCRRHDDSGSGCGPAQRDVSLTRAFDLPAAVDPAKIQARLDRDWLQLEMPRNGGSAPRRLKVTIQ